MRALWLLLLLLIALQSHSTAQNLDAKAVAERALSLRSGFTAMVVVARPGEEDVATMASLRSLRGVRLHVVYVSNGEGLPFRRRDAYPFTVAAERRTAADEVARMMRGDARFLNLPDIITPADSLAVDRVWDPESLQVKLITMISKLRPDLILVQGTPDEAGDRRMAALRTATIEAAKRLRLPKTDEEYRRMLPVPRWTVQRIVAESTVRSAKALTAKAPTRAKALAAADSAHAAYDRRALTVQTDREHKRYLCIYEHDRVPRANAFFEGLPVPAPPALQGLRTELTQFADSILHATRRTMSVATRDRLKRRMTRLYGLIEMRMMDKRPKRVEEEEALRRWRQGVIEMRLLLAGVSTSVRQSERVLSNIQLSEIVFDQLTGLPKKDSTVFYLPSARLGSWVINEQWNNSVRVEAGFPLRLISPGKSMVYSYPIEQYGLERETLMETVEAYVIHRAPTPEESYVIPIELRYHFSPKMNVLPLEPIIRCVPGEEIPVRLQVHSRDPVRGAIAVEHASIVSTTVPFAFEGKGQMHVDTMRLWSVPSLPDTSLFLPLAIDGFVEAGVGARVFQAAIDSQRNIVVWSRSGWSALRQAIRRLGWSATVVENLPDTIPSVERATIVADHGVLTNASDADQLLLWEHARRGAHVMFLTQSPESWNSGQGADVFSLEGSALWTGEDSLVVDDSHGVVTEPNALGRKDYIGWMGPMAVHTLRLAGGSRDDVHVPMVVRSGSRSTPGIVMFGFGKGRVSYVNLHLTNQMLNVHHGVFRLLANLLSASGEMPGRR